MRRQHPGYSLSAYGEMLTDSVRADAYVDAMRQTIRPGDIVLDIGAGPGFFSMLAAKLGAAKVIAVEPNPAIRIAKQLVRKNNLSEQVVCIEGISTDLTLDEPANVIVSDLRGVLPFHTQHIPSIIDARERLLAPGGHMIPLRDTLHAAPVSSPNDFKRIIHPWLENKYKLDLSLGSTLQSNRWTKARLTSDQLLSESQAWHSLDYAKLTEHSAHGNLSWEINTPGLMHGIACWFDTELTPGVGFSNHPESAPLIYGQAFMPFPQDIFVNRGDRVRCEIHAHWVSDDYIWQWNGEVEKQDGSVLCRFNQSTFLGRVPYSSKS